MVGVHLCAQHTGGNSVNIGGIPCPGSSTCFRYMAPSSPAMVSHLIVVLRSGGFRIVLEV